MKNKSIKNIINKKNVLHFVIGYGDKGKRRWIKVFVVLACLVLSVLFLYDPAKQYYKSVREHDKLTIQYQTLRTANEELSNQVQNLQTEEGIKQAAIENLGLVQNGESTAHVNGLSYTPQDEREAWENSPKNTWKNAKYPKTWYSGVLDVIFRVTN